MREAHRNAYYVVQHDIAQRLVALRRTTTAFEDLDAVKRNHDELREALLKLAAERLLLDLSDGPAGRNDAAFENAIQGTRLELSQRYKRVAVLVRSAAGKLQIQRLGRQDGVPVVVFLDEKEALAYLTSTG